MREYVPNLDQVNVIGVAACCVAVCCSVLQCAAVCCSVLKCVVLCCSVLQCVAVCCSVLQCVASSFSIFVVFTIDGTWLQLCVFFIIKLCMCEKGKAYIRVREANGS